MSNSSSETSEAKRARTRKRFLFVTTDDRKITTTTTDTTPVTPKCETSGGKVAVEVDDAALERLAAEELLKEAARAKARADVGGASEWKKKPKRLNMRFVANSLLQTESQNRRKSKQQSK